MECSKKRKWYNHKLRVK